MGAPAPGGDRDPETREAFGQALMLLAAVGSALVVSWLVSRFHPTAYVPVLMPAILGWGVGTAVVFFRVRFQVASRAGAVGVTLFGAALAYATYHVLVWVEITDFLATHLPSLVERAAADPRVQVQGFFDEETGHTGLLAYLAFVSEGEAAELSPLGLLGRAEPGLALTLLGIAVETLVALGTATGLMLLRSRHGGLDAGAAPPLPDGPRVREIIARTDVETLSSALHAVERGDCESAGRILRRPVPHEVYALALVHSPYSADDWVLEVLELESTGEPGRTRVTRTLSSWDGQALFDELRLKR